MRAIPVEAKFARVRNTGGQYHHFLDENWGLRPRGEDVAVSLRESALPKAFGIGLGKTGTTSRREALTILGWRSIHNPPTDIVEHLLAEDPGWYNAFSDNPPQRYFRELDALYSGSKFVYTTRPVEDWIASCIRDRDAWGAPGWDFDHEKLRRWWDWHHGETQKHFGGCSC